MGIFDPDMIADAWFDPCVQLIAWFDDGFIEAASSGGLTHNAKKFCRRFR